MPAIHCYMKRVDGVNVSDSAYFLASITYPEADRLWNLCKDECLRSASCTKIYMVGTPLQTSDVGGYCNMTSIIGSSEQLSQPSCTAPSCVQAVKTHACWPQLPSPSAPPIAMPPVSAISYWLPWLLVVMACLLSTIIVIMLCRSNRRVRVLRAEVSRLREAAQHFITHRLVKPVPSRRFNASRRTIHHPVDATLALVLHDCTAEYSDACPPPPLMADSSSGSGGSSSGILGGISDHSHQAEVPSGESVEVDAAAASADQPPHTTLPVVAMPRPRLVQFVVHPEPGVTSDSN